VASSRSLTSLPRGRMWLLRSFFNSPLSRPSQSGFYFHIHFDFANPACSLILLPAPQLCSPASACRYPLYFFQLDLLHPDLRIPVLICASELFPFFLTQAPRGTSPHMSDFYDLSARDPPPTLFDVTGGEGLFFFYSAFLVLQNTSPPSIVQCHARMWAIPFSPPPLGSTCRDRSVPSGPSRCIPLHTRRAARVSCAFVCEPAVPTLASRIT